ncbi:sensor histidine kinase [Lysinibacillus fusiformis]|uniref:sensor histidine kinase n=1 Tax=Lysinibacillus fusiformis TaxID=28031 RepID=UPI003D049789
MNNNTMSFKVSSGLKNLIGKELITNEFVAIFELVKNSFDAHAKNVKIVFNDIYKNNASIVIFDDGKGMDIEDIENKWLFVAYSAKKDGTEDDRETKDYREKLKSKRGYAGAKGVGRFSCDRLASNLNLITIKDKVSAKIENIKVDWEKFEKDQTEEFLNINVTHDTLNSCDYPISHGTILELTKLRDKWDRKKILNLKKSLEKLINPNEQDEEFSIEIIVNDEKKIDDNKKDDNDKVNGYVKNTIFKVLEIKTMRIHSRITEDGAYIKTTLEDRGKIIYKLIEVNPFHLLKNINIEIFYLNRSAKIHFKKIMGVDSVNYGSIFLFKNGFRIFPIGDVGDDPFGMDKRKTQGYARYLGSREVIGRIEIAGVNEELKETTSRDGGLIKNESYIMLEKSFYSSLRRLEKYLIDIIRWGDPIKTEGIESPALYPEDVKEDILKFIKKISKANDVISIEYDEDFFDIIEERQDKSVSKEISDLAKTALRSTDNKDLHKEITKIGKRFNQLLDEKESFEEEIIFREFELEKKEEEITQTKSELKQTFNQNLFLKSVSTLDLDNIISLHHQIGIYSNDINAQLVIWNRRIANGKEFSIEQVKKMLDNIEFLNKKIISVVKFATKANFNLQSEKIEADLVIFIEDYIENVCRVMDDNDLIFKISSNPNNSFVTKFKPIELSIVLDNLINNSRKFKAQNISIELVVENDKLILNFVDDGHGLDESIKNYSKIFEKGFSTTSGSGLGLFHTQQILSELNGTISVLSNIEKGVGFKIEVQK